MRPNVVARAWRSFSTQRPVPKATPWRTSRLASAISVTRSYSRAPQPSQSIPSCDGAPSDPISHNQAIETAQDPCNELPSDIVTNADNQAIGTAQNSYRERRDKVTRPNSRTARSARHPDDEAPPIDSVTGIDHRIIGTDQDLFGSTPFSPGSPYFHPDGAHIFNKLMSFLRAQYKQYGFEEVITPTMYKKSLWEKSGHWHIYKDDMYEVRGRGATGQTVDVEIGEDEQYGLKPMNCPGHCVLFASKTRSYRSLPVRFAEFSPLHRNEISGSLSGLTRVRRFHQDDGHIFCRPEQIEREIELTLQFTESVLSTFGLEDYRLVLSTRPEKDYLGSLALWNDAENQLKDALDKSGKPWHINEGDGAFYGPKIDLQIRDSRGKYHQLSTIQLDMNLPQRFGLEYVVPGTETDVNGPRKATPVLIHRAIFGSLERFFALLAEHYNGRWPFWLSPRQGIILTVNNDPQVLRTAQTVASGMRGYQSLTFNESEVVATPGLLYPAQATFQIDVDTSSRSLGKKIREAMGRKYKLVFVIGPSDVSNGSVGVDLTGLLGGRSPPEIKQWLQNTPGWDFVISPDGRSVKMTMKADDVYDWLIKLEKEFW
ncbi:hypothetical protein D8B26_005571 [Coccidioides posadasii str. Silveira]|uniref:threonine--tRNA ligase n=3 Tax=Coccidioides posadasii TaxID=199306 RepID=E9D3W7_COCPS|nr:threonyl-tRNA synthetase, putative [Coccidioides posadasii C735 delta SOWgp]EER26877.1 threonyl-tRNA synthetase, putative [Coccidioides posadasii C735 delta SOWgp]EFW18760.1 threonyl-tRNA synthetase [Coccidioides posadasii str. Silveira]KMM72400.1 threonyl-tRNA synthetase [Coccidioides posadasii RMSCC 3488]QVM10918.1 hypothetical protein D8B26_005571 [Coccidioides posadasii str. Silveira]|eukprot:XP_003069022.1 threonyl-tRNA synthetase, putative [Coccidioides posadasii C735 delta SOWgp]